MVSFDIPVVLKPQDAEASSTQPPDNEKKEEFYPTNAIDGKPTTGWSSDSSEPQWLLADLGDLFDLDKVVISWEVAYSTSYKVSVSVDKGSWNEVYSTEEGKGRFETVSFPLQSARYIKIDCLKRKGEGGFSIWDVSVYGKRKLILF